MVIWYGSPPGNEIGYIAAPRAIISLVWTKPGQVRSKQPVVFEASAYYCTQKRSIDWKKNPSEIYHFKFTELHVILTYGCCTFTVQYTNKRVCLSPYTLGFTWKSKILID